DGGAGTDEVDLTGPFTAGVGADITVSATNETQELAGVITTGGSLSFAMPARLAANTSLTAASMTFASTVDGKSGNNYTFSAVATSGQVIIPGNIGATGMKSVAITNGKLGTAGAAFSIVSTTTQSYAGQTTLVGNATLVGTDVTIGRLDALSGQTPTLTINASGVTRFDGPVGATSPIGAITTDAAGRTELAGSIKSAGTGITWNDPVLVVGDASIEQAAAGNVTFASTVDGGAGGAYSLAITTPADKQAVFKDDVGAGALGVLSNSQGLGSLTTSEATFEKVATLASGAHLVFSAAADVTANTAWENTGASGTGYSATGLAGATKVTNPTTSRQGITADYSFTGTSSGAVITSSLDRLNGGGTLGEDVTVELWVRPADLTGDEIIFEVGGSSGFAITMGDGTTGATIPDSDIAFRMEDGSSTKSVTLHSSLSTIGISEFVHVVVTYVVSSRLTTMYLNGRQVAQATGNSGIGRWLDTDDSGIARAGNRVGGYVAKGGVFTPFKGEIAI
ncbi:MAG TPA: hypothetical protein PLV92_22445, partial [Pirellulaceae bacterium]|nr:hypothetical protein [Pirellulaceae bacterium]